MANNNMNNGLRNAKVNAPSTVDVIVAELGKEKYLANNTEISLREIKALSESCFSGLKS